MSTRNLEILRRRPVLAVAVLAIGWVSYWILCSPSIGRRGYPEIDPFWLAMPKLWIVPILISAIWEDHRRRRLVSLLGFSMLTGFVHAGTIITVVPNYVTYPEMLLRTIFWGPVHFVVCLVIEAASQRLLHRFRCFEDSTSCLICGYSLLKLTVARCPECGEPFDGRILTEPQAIVGREWPSRTVRLAGIVVVCTALFPVGYRAACLETAEARGRACAERDWRAASATWYVTREEEAAIVNAAALLGDEQPGPLVHEGVEVRVMSGGPERVAFMKAYRNVIAKKLALDRPSEQPGATQ